MEHSGEITVTGLYRYPVKGLSAEPLDRVALRAGQTVPFDRAWAIENGPGRFDPDAPKHLPKIVFLMLMRNERLAALQTLFDSETQTLTIHRDGRQVARGQLTTQIGRQMLEQFFAAYMKDDLRGAPKIVFAQEHSFSDVKDNCLHIVNRASLDELTQAAGDTVDALRFRPNVVIEGADAWAEFSWVGKRIRIGGVELDVFDRTQRCAATEVDPETGARNLAVPALMERTWDHSEFGVYARVVSTGEISIGNTISVQPDV